MIMIQTLLKQLMYKGNSPYLDVAHTFYERLMSGNICAEEAYSSNVLEKSRTVLKECRVCEKPSRTSALWVQYMSMIDILHKFIRAERTGN